MKKNIHKAVAGNGRAVNELRKASKRFGLSPGRCAELADILEDRTGMQ